MQKGSAQLFLIIVLIVAVAGIFFYQLSKGNYDLKTSEVLVPKKDVSKKDPGESFTSELGFEFKYSKDLTVKVDSEEEYSKRGTGASNDGPVGDYRKNFKGYVGYEPPKFLSAMVVLEKEEDYGTNPFSLWVFENSNNLTKEAWFDRYWYYPFLWGVFDYTSKGHVALDAEATISGQLAKYKIVSYQQGKPKFLYISKDQKMYLFKVIGEKGENILNSFNFD